MQEAPLYSFFSRIRWIRANHRESQESERMLHQLSGANLRCEDVCINDKGHYLHTVLGGPEKNGANSTDEAMAMVCIPGYGAGSGFFFRIFKGLASAWKLYAVDLLGTGLSSRPPFRAKNTEQAESFFVESLEAWREAVGLEEFILMGHSMGGYLAALYAIQYPNRVRHLVMVCPAGVGKRPDTWEPPESVRSPWTWKGQLYRLAVNIWNAGITPGLIIRSMGPFGPSLVEKYTRNRFKTGHHLSEEEIEAFHKYMYGILAAKGSGEYALKHILEPFAFPRQPLEHRMDSITFPITFIYGDQDWMDPKAAKRLLNRVRDARQRKLVESDLKVLTTVSAGHYPFLDQPGAFLMNILDTCGCYLSHEARKKIERIAQEYPVLSLPAMDTEEQLRKEFAKDPATAEVHIASDL